MLLVISTAVDAEAKELITRWADHDAVLLTCRDLSASGWRQHIAGPGSSSAGIGGTVIPVGAVTAVLTRRPWVFPEELTHIAVADREYVAAEMSAFLVAWLSSLTCPVINRPTPMCLSGPGWRQHQWMHLAASLGLRPSWDRWQIPPAAEHQNGHGPQAGTVEVTVVGRRCFGAPDPVTAAAAQRLADAARVTLAGFRFAADDSGLLFTGASLWPALTDTPVADAVLDSLLRQSA
jgi:hypothetical protein